MSDPTHPRGEVHLCRHLRWKGLIGATFQTQEALARALNQSDSPFTCLHSCQPWGPDDDMASPERCAPDRGCYERSPRIPRAREAQVLS